MGPSLFQKWQLKTLNGNDITGDYMRPVFIEFTQDGSKVSGSAACNRFFGTYTLSGTALNFSQMGSTKMFCDDASNKLETEFLRSLEKVNNYRIENNSLILLGNAEVIARFDSFNPAPDELAGTWQLFYITGRRIAFEGLYPDRKPFIKFKQGAGEFASNTSCNSLMGTYNGKKGEKLLNLGAMTLMACPGEGEQAYLDQLKEVDRFQVSGDTLTFFYKDIPNMKFVKTEQ